MTDIDPIMTEFLQSYRQITLEELKPSQRKVAESFLKQVAERNARVALTDLKKLEITSSGSGLVFITVEYGIPNDEGTAASIYCRDYRHVMLRSRGGIELLNAKRKSYSYGLWQAVHELTK